MHIELYVYTTIIEQIDKLSKMSSRKQKKQLSLLENVNTLTDQELREALKNFDQAPGPITESTRNLYRRKLASLIEEDTAFDPKNGGGDLNDDSDTSDEDYNVQDEESEEDEEDDEDYGGDDDDELLDELDDGIKLSSASIENENFNTTTSVIAGPDAAPNRISRGILILLISFFVAIFSLYLYSGSNYKLLSNSPPFKTISKQILAIFILATIGYSVYATVKYYRQRRHQEMQRVCSLVNDALELLQSPDNPKGMMPILHIRDTLLTPPERKAKKMINLWNKAAKFIEEHESRVKVELVNIDGEDFRAWKWIGSRKL